MRTWFVPLVPAITLFLACVTPQLALAEWPASGRAVSTDPKNQDRPKVTTDGANGAIIVWQDARLPRINVFARRVLASGELDPAWPVDGRALLTDSTALATAVDGQQLPVIVADGTGGAIVAWQDGRTAGGLDIFAQHVLASGVVDPAWPANGRALCTARGSQDVPTIVSDGAGGAIVTWMDRRSSVTDVDIFAQHVLASGAVDPNWPADGVALCTAPAQQVLPNIASDGSGGAIVSWFDFRPSTSSADIYAQHVTSSGRVDAAWPANGRALCLAAGAQLDPTIISDGVHGAIVTWDDFRDGTGHIYAERVTGSGTIAPGWPLDGRAVCTAPIGQEQPILTPDGASGAIVTWRDLRNNVNDNPFAQHILASGVIDAAWPVNGRALSLSGGEEFDPTITGDGAGGAIVAWQEDFFIFVQHLRASGVLDSGFPVNGLIVRLNLDFQQTPDLTAAGAGTAIVTWANATAGSTFDIFAMQVLTRDAVDVESGLPPHELTFANPSSNPTHGPVTLKFAIPHAAPVTLDVYDVRGRRVRDLVSGALGAGPHTIAWDLHDQSGRTAGAGLYFVRLESEGRVLTRKLTTLK